MRKIVLASASPRRREILAKTGLAFSVDRSGYEEDLAARKDPHALARFLSREKARSVARRHPDSIIIAADTFIVFRRHILGKPHTAVEAARMLTLLSGKAHSVITGFTVMDTRTGRTISRSEETKVWFRRLSQDEIAAYVRTKEPLDKAGAYAIQERGAALVRKIEGDFFNVVGLPLFAVVETLRRSGVRLLQK